jgi:hypothetical protein
MTNREEDYDNMKWNKATAVLLAAMALIAMLTACGGKTVEQVNAADDTSMFVEVERTASWRIVYHKQTKVMYAVSDDAYNFGNFTLLVNADGSPMLYDGGEDND